MRFVEIIGMHQTFEGIESPNEISKQQTVMSHLNESCGLKITTYLMQIKLNYCLLKNNTYQTKL